MGTLVLQSMNLIKIFPKGFYSNAFSSLKSSEESRLYNGGHEIEWEDQLHCVVRVIFSKFKRESIELRSIH